MGFGNGVGIFDDIVRVVLPMDLSDEQKVKVIVAVIVALEDHDWDTQDDSQFIEYPLVRQAFERTGWFFEEEEND